MSRADGLPRTNYVDENGKYLGNRPVGWYNREEIPTPRVARVGSSDRELLCLQIKQQKELWENSRSEQGRKNAAEYRYQYSKNDCHNVLP